MFIQAALVFVQIVLHSTSQKKARKMNEVRHLSTAILLQFPFHVFGFCAYQTLNEYLDTKKQIQMFSLRIIIRIRIRS